MIKTKLGVMLIAIFMVISIALVGCGNSENSNVGQEENNTEPNNNEETEKSEEEKTVDFKVGMVTDIGGVNDNSFNQSAWEGLQELQAETGIEIDYLQSQSDADYVPNLNQFVKADWDVTWGIGFMMGDSIQQVAAQNPNSILAIIDAVVEEPNTASVTFKEHEGSFLVGVVAGLMTESNKIGFIGGMEIPVITRFEVGFLEGVKAANPNAEVIINYTGAFNDPGQGKAAAATIYNQGTDIIFHAAGSTGDGVFNEAKERNKGDEQVWVIGVDKDQSVTFGHDVTLTSMMKRVDQGVKLITERAIAGELEEGAVYTLGLQENGVGLPEENPNIPQEVLDKVADYKQKIIDGEIVVSSDK